MSHPNILILEENDLAAMTLASIKAYAPKSKVAVVSCDGEGSRIRTALQCTNKVTLCVQSGVILQSGIIYMPPMARLSSYSITISRAHVFIDHPRQSHIYGLMGLEAHKGVMDTSVFFINPERWPETPLVDRGAMRDKKKLVMPRYMNHKADAALEAVSAWGALQYGMLGHGAGILNYTQHYLRGYATPNEMYGYPLELALPFIDDLQPTMKDRVWRLGSKAKTVGALLRTGLQTFYE